MRKRIVRDDDYCKNEKLAPLLAPRWTRTGYKGRLKDAVIESIESQSENNGYDADTGEKMDEEKEDNEKDEEGKDEEGVEKAGEETVEEEETVLLSSEDQHIDWSSDDEHLEMDDGS